MNRSENINLKFCLFNVENLFLLFDEPPSDSVLKLDEIQWQKLSTALSDNKPLKKLHALAKVILDIHADIYMFCEVGGAESLNHFNRLFLNSEFSTCLIEGNSDRNIDVGFLIRKGLPFYFDLQTNKNHRLEVPEKLARNNAVTQLFSRDVTELRLFEKCTENPFLLCLLTHLKSTRDPHNIDPNGSLKRTAEVKGLVEIYQDLKLKNPKTPILVCGDFNGNASLQKTDPEFKIIYEVLDLKDILELAQVEKEARSTFYQVSNISLTRTEGKQIDFCFLNTEAQKHLQIPSVQVYRYKDEFGSPLPPPKTLAEKQGHPSDHYPVIFKLENLSLTKEEQKI
ncbi:MAG TPA: hypothetical protein PLJ21_06775 [Pseudobdellovibrionaceae bacterium]|nr:hypothetical protein [Pseudobdellovibrionaceae bacterium]